MKKSKKLFTGFAVAFLLLLFYASYDIASRTTFPHRKKTGKPAGELQKRDSIPADTANFIDQK